MKRVLFICCLTFVSATDPWLNFKVIHGKSYTNAKEESYRRSVFEANSKFVEEHNTKFANGEVTFDVALNRFADMTTEEFMNEMTSLKKLKRTEDLVYARFPETRREAEVDWRDSGAVTPIKDQGQCGSCWAFSATGSIESAHFIKYGEVVTLSEQQLLDCSSENAACHGGVVQWAFDYVKAAGGLQCDCEYPYEAQNGTCRFDPQKTVATVKNYFTIPYGDEVSQAAAVHDVGPVSVSVDAGHTSFRLYNSGIYYERWCSPDAINHGVLAVGYGTEGSDDYWTIKNSWGTGWGEDGYMKIARNKGNHCGISSQSCYPVV